MNTIANIATGFIAGLSTDVLILIVLATLFFFYGVHRGTHKLASILIAFFVATLLVKIFPFDIITIINTFWSDVIIWLVFVLIIKAISERIVNLPSTYGGTSTWIESGLLTLVVVSSLVFILYGILGFNSVYTPTMVSVKTLANPAQLFWSIIGSFVVLYYIVFW